MCQPKQRHAFYVSCPPSSQSLTLLVSRNYPSHLFISRGHCRPPRKYLLKEGSGGGSTGGFSEDGMKIEHGPV